MARAAVLVGMLALAAACTTAPSPRRPALSDAELLSGAALAIPRDAPVPIAAADVARLDAAMLEFVAREVGSASDARSRLQKLLQGMRDNGLLELDYAGMVTRTASTTFHEREGNCLSFTILFVALARAAGLEVSYQIVDVPPTWSAETDLVVVRHHINAAVKTGFNESYVVDFNLVTLEGNYRKRVVDDAHVLALFYNNLGAEAMLRKDYAASFVLLKEAVRAKPQMATPWVNLGALYSRSELTAQAEAAYLHALAADPSERSALSNLASLYFSQGDTELAEVYRQRIRHYQERNPYYHYALAEQAYGSGQFADSLAELRTALRLKRDEPQFYVLQGRAQLALGRSSSAASSFLRGRGYAGPAGQLAEYDARVQAVLDDRAATL